MKPLPASASPAPPTRDDRAGPAPRPRSFGDAGAFARAMQRAAARPEADSAGTVWPVPAEHAWRKTPTPGLVTAPRDLAPIAVTADRRPPATAEQPSLLPPMIALPAFPAHAPVDAAPPSPPDLARSAVASALVGLLAPAEADGVQHWQFSFSEPGLPLTGLAVTMAAAPGQAMLLRLQLPPHSRERAILTAGLDGLRERLAARGAGCTDIMLHDETTDR